MAWTKERQRAYDRERYQRLKEERKRKPGRMETPRTERERTLDAHAKMLCIHDGSPCVYSRRCLYNFAGSKSAKMNMCVVASAGTMSTCGTCAEKDRCDDSWKCVRRECTA